MNEKVKYVGCYSCIGYIIENIKIISPCIRGCRRGYEFPNNCPKRARGLNIMGVPKWEEITDEEFKRCWDIGLLLRSTVKIFDDKGMMNK